MRANSIMREQARRCRCRLHSLAYHNNQMRRSRRHVLLSVLATGILAAHNQDTQDQNQNRTLPIPPNPNEDAKLPNGKSQKDAIAKQEHEQTLKDADDLIAVAQQLKEELQKAGDYVVPVSSVKKTEEIERLARRIRGRLRD